MVCSCFAVHVSTRYGEFYVTLFICVLLKARCLRPTSVLYVRRQGDIISDHAGASCMLATYSCVLPATEQYISSYNSRSINSSILFGVRRIQARLLLKWTLGWKSQNVRTNYHIMHDHTTINTNAQMYGMIGTYCQYVLYSLQYATCSSLLDEGVVLALS